MAFIIIPLVAACVGAALLLLVDQFGIWKVPLPFSRQLWLAGARSVRGDPVRDRNNPRLRIVGTVLARHVRRGVSRQQVIALLGQPECDYPKAHADEVGGDAVIGYTLGSPYFDEEFLMISFDRSGRVIRAWITQT